MFWEVMEWPEWFSGLISLIPMFLIIATASFVNFEHKRRKEPPKALIKMLQERLLQMQLLNKDPFSIVMKDVEEMIEKTRISGDELARYVKQFVIEEENNKTKKANKPQS